MTKYIKYSIFLLFLIIHSNINATKIKILAKVNNQIITNIDLEYRLNLALEISNIPNEAKFRKEIRQQMLDLLIDENLKLQAAERIGILVSSSEVYTEINRLEQRLKLPKNSLINNFKKKNIPEITVYNQIRGQLLWNKLISYTIANNITISFDQKEEALKNFIANSGEVEYNISEIFISSNTKTLENFSKEKIYSIFNKANPSNFTNLTQQFSDGALNINSWVRESALNQEVIKIVQKLEVGEISIPVKTSLGFHIYLLNDKRKTKKIVENEALYNISQIFYKTSSLDNKQLAEIKNELFNLKKSIKNCFQLEDFVKKDLNSTGGSLGTLSSKSLDRKFLDVLENGLNVGQLSDVIITSQGIHSIMLCEPVKAVNLDELRDNIEQKLRIEKINNAANLFLNSIRQRALIEINSI